MTLKKSNYWPHRASLALLLLASLVSLVSPCLAQSSDDVDFFRTKVKPILQENCFECHGGSDGKGGFKVKSGLQLISRKGLLKGGQHGPAYNDKDPLKSLVLEVVSYSNDDLQMPPKNKLDAEQVGLIAEWVKRGVPWTPEDADLLHEIADANSENTTVNEKTKAHWSYRKMLRPEVPTAGTSAAFVHPIDRLLEVKRAANGLSANPIASKAELLRRATFDLTGLAPTARQIADFEADKSLDAWQKQVDRLLALPQYGEKWGRHWLDLVRYAETNGFERDSDKPFVWRYRDYIIDSFNQDKPYDQFLTEQLAGDEIANPTADSMIATGYHRLMQWDDEPADRLQHMYDVIDDNVRVTTETMLGMTVGCARCHDHKGDPIPQKDYYQFASFFRNIKSMGRGDENLQQIAIGSSGGPEQTAALQAEKKSLLDKIALAEKQYLELPVMKNAAASGLAADLITDARKKPWSWHYTTEKPADDWNLVSFRAENQNWKQGVAGFGTEVPDAQARTTWKSKEIWLQTTFLLEKIPKSLAMSLYHDEEVVIYCNGQMVFERKAFNAQYENIAAPVAFIAALQTGRNVIAVHVNQSSGGQFFDMGLSSVGRSLREEILDPSNKLVQEHTRTGYQQALQRTQEIEKALDTRQEKVMVVAENGGKVPPTFIHMRGSAHAEGEEVQPKFPEIFGGLTPVITPPANGKSSGRRLALAQWITHPKNPRTARVMVNRLWQHHFGRGLCATPNDLGFLGLGTNEPELIDWLATEFVVKKWSIKAMHRVIMSSAAYQMSNRRQDAALAKDGGNELWWRFLPRRMSAEELRDNMLLATGELSLERGGPSFFVPIPEEVLVTSSTKGNGWRNNPPEQTNRRSVYAVSRRSLQVPLFSEHDQADTDSPCPVRFTTIVPTQALGMINSDFVHQKAKAFAKRLVRDAGPESSAQVRLAYQLAVQRVATDVEVKRAVDYMQLMQGEQKLSIDESLQRFCLAVFSFNEFIFID